MKYFDAEIAHQDRADEWSRRAPAAKQSSREEADKRMAVVWELLARMREKQVKEGTTQPGFSHDLLLVRVPRVENYSNAASTNCFSTYSRLETAVRRARQRGELLLPGLKNRIYDDDHTRGERKAGAGCRDLTSCRGGQGCGPVTAAAISALAPPGQTFARGRDFAA
jgi:hypothetical protein